MKSSPAPMIVELSDELRNIVSSFIVEDDLLRVESTKDEILNRIGLQLIILPSGQSLPHPIQTAPGGMIYGKLLYGGCKRYRLLPGGGGGGGGGNKNNKLRRRTGERTTIKLNERENVKSWLQYGGPERNYESMDIGSCALLEISILPKGLEMKSSTPRAVDVGGEKDDDLFGIQNSNNVDIMNLSRFGWDINNMIDYYQFNDNITDINTETTNASRDYLLSMSGKERNNYIQTNFTQRVGGLSSEIQTIVRRVMDGRFESEELQLLGLSPVRGLLLYGPPGCGKTALAREISKALAVHISSGTCNEPKIVSAPELLDRWVGGSEKLIRQLFNDAENELKSCGGDATKSSLHVIVIDEIDAVFRKRTSSDDSAQVTRASAVNQILAKLDGVNAIPNVLLIGMTNRRELLDEALLRPGRLEVQILIPKPDREGRREILQIHFEPLRKNGRLSQQLCQAIDGGIFSSSQQEILAKPTSSYDAVTTKESDKNLIDTETKKLSRLRGLLQLSSASTKKIMRRSVEKISLYSNRDDNKKDGINVWRKFKRPITDLAADHITGGFTGADVAGLVRCAGSIALSRARNEGFGSIDGLLITLDDVMEALEEVKNRET
jgi:vesicle-fusing ATPase